MTNGKSQHSKDNQQNKAVENNNLTSKKIWKDPTFETLESKMTQSFTGSGSNDGGFYS